MLGLMQDWPLLLHRIIDHAAIQHGGREVVSRAVEDGTLRRSTYADVRQRALKVARRLSDAGIRQGDRVATLAWNSERHLELWYGITGLARSRTPSIQGCSPSRSPGSSIMPRTGCCFST